MHAALQQFHPVVAKWFEERVGVPTPPQVLGWPVIGEGKSALILAPTGSGKTLAAFLAGIDWLARQLVTETDTETRGHGDRANTRMPGISVSPRRRVAASLPHALHGVQILYVSPLKALANDVRKNLLKPLEELADV